MWFDVLFLDAAEGGSSRLFEILWFVEWIYIFRFNIRCLRIEILCRYNTIVIIVASSCTVIAVLAVLYRRSPYVLVIPMQWKVYRKIRSATTVISVAIVITVRRNVCVVLKRVSSLFVRLSLLAVEWKVFKTKVEQGHPRRVLYVCVWWVTSKKLHSIITVSSVYFRGINNFSRRYHKCSLS